MSAHLLQVSAERLAALPEGVLARTHESGWDGRTSKRCGGMVVRFDHAAEVDTVRGSAWLVLTDTVTAAAVAARIIWPWLDEHVAPEGWRVVERAISMEPLTPADLDILTRLARAAMEGA